jgi:hypothetical protein
MKGLINKMLLVCLLSLAVRAQAQQEVISMPRFKLGIEAGMSAIFDASINKPTNLRENKSYYNDDYYCGFIFDKQEYDQYYIGIKPEYTLTKRLAVAAGLRLTFAQSVLESNSRYFLWKTAESGTTTDYVRVNNISQQNIFVGIPLELKIFPREKDYFVRHYFVMGTAMNFLAGSKNTISFSNSQMEKYEPLISGHTGTPNRFHGYAYTGFGLKIGRTNHTFGNIEFHYPILMFDNKRLSSFMETRNSFGFGIQTTLQIPLFKQHTLKYKADND